MTTQIAGHRPRLASLVTAVALALLIAVFGVVDLLLAARTHQLAPSTALVGSVDFVTVLVGLTVAVRQPRNAIGWCLMGVPFFSVVNIAASTYSVLDYRMRHGTLPLGAVAVLLQPSWAPGIVLFVFAVLLFPDGVRPSGLSRWAMWIVTAVGVVWIAGALGIAVTAIFQHNVRVDGGGNLLAIDHSTGAWAWWGVFQNAVFPAFVASLLLWGVAQVPNYRRSSGDRRLQLKWLYGGVVICICSALALFAVGNYSASQAVEFVVKVVLAMGVAALPISMGVAVLKLRLYDIDRVVSRTLSYALVTGLVAGVYVGVITLSTKALGFHTPIAVAASTLAAVALFNPLRVRIQRVVDRRFNRAHYDAEATVSAFTARLRDAVDLDTVRSELLEVVNQAVEPAHASVWIRRQESSPTPYCHIERQARAVSSGHR